MTTDCVLHRFVARDGREVILRTPTKEDLHEDFINSIVTEDLDVLPERKKMTKNQVAEWLERRLLDIKNGKAIDIVAEIDGKVVADSEVIPDYSFFPTFSHVGEMGIMIRSGYRDLGIGTQMIKTLIQESRKKGLKALVLYVFANNSRAIHFYEKMGFKETGRIPKGVYRKNQYVDKILMTLTL